MGLGTFLSVYGGKSKHIREFNGGEKRGGGSTAAVCANKKSFSSSSFSSSSSSSSLLLLKTFDTGGRGGENEHARFPNISCQKCGGREKEKRIIPTVKNSLEKGEAEILRVVKRRQLPEQKMLRKKKTKKRNRGDVKLSRGGGFG